MVRHRALSLSRVVPCAAVDGCGGIGRDDETDDENLKAVLEMLDGAPSWSLQELVPGAAETVSAKDLEELARLSHVSLPSDASEKERLRMDIERVLGFLGTVHDAVPSADQRILAPPQMFDDGALREDTVSEGDCAHQVLANTANCADQGGLFFSFT